MPSLYALKPWYTRTLTPVLEAADRARVSPDAFTWLGVVAAGVAGAAIASGCWIGALSMLALRLAGANLDGALARRRGTERPWGFVLNEVGDRVADLLMFAGLTLLVWRTGDHLGLVAVLLAAVASTLPTFASLAVAGAGGARYNGGPVGKTERCLAAVVICAYPPSAVVVCAVLVTGAVATGGQRLWRGHRALSTVAAMS